MNGTKHQVHEQGFTIIELMIATAVLAIILLLATVIMTSIGSLYDKGINQARIQDATRTATDQLAQDLKFNNGSITVGSGTATTPFGKTIMVHAYCIGNSIRYSYVLGYKLGTSHDTDTGSGNPTTESPDVLWRDNLNNDDATIPPASLTRGSTCDPVNIASQAVSGAGTEGAELIAPDSRLTAFCIGTISAGVCSSDADQTISSPYNLTIEMAYGDIDLLDSNFITQQENVNTAGEQDSDVACHGGTGDQFCATSILTTTVVQRAVAD